MAPTNGRFAPPPGRQRRAPAVPRARGAVDSGRHHLLGRGVRRPLLPGGVHQGVRVPRLDLQAPREDLERSSSVLKPGQRCFCYALLLSPSSPVYLSYLFLIYYCYYVNTIQSSLYGKICEMQ